MNAVEALGLVAGTLTTIAFVPQVLRVWRRRSARDLSWAMMTIFTTGVGLWLVYGLLLGAPAIIAANAVTFVLTLALCVMKWRFNHTPAPPAAAAQSHASTQEMQS
ncbi:MAG: SemiSWEET transporter [Casimicrobiaceae bacterium]|nr:SemiSWEET transporter [Casimicrobiaceae bacterium]